MEERIDYAKVWQRLDEERVKSEELLEGMSLELLSKTGKNRKGILPK